MPDHSRPNARHVSALLLLAFTTTPAAATPPPWIAQDFVSGLAVQAAGQLPDTASLNATPATYDVATQRWSMTFITLSGKSINTTIDETTGRVCARYPEQRTCAATANVMPTIERAKALYAAQEDARRNPAPDMEGLWLTILRTIRPDTYPSFHEETWYLSLTDTDGKRIDPPATILENATLKDVHLLPMSSAPDINKQPYVADRWTIGQPLRRADGDYDLSYGHRQGIGGGSWTARLRHDTAGWHVLWTQSAGFL